MKLMKKLLTLLILLCLRAHGQVTIPQCVANSNTGSSKITSLTATLSATTSGSLIYVAVKEGYNTTDTFTVTDSSSQAYSNTGYLNNMNERMNVFYFPNSTSITTITASFSTSGGISAGSGGSVGIVACEIKGIATSNPYDAGTSATTSSNTASITSGSLTTSYASDILLYTVFPSGNYNYVSLYPPGYKILASSPTANAIITYNLTPYLQNHVTTSVAWNLPTNGVCTWFTAFKAAVSVTPVTKRNAVVF